jgi:hypothetical protein
MTGPAIISWSDLVCVTNTGTGRRANSLFVTLGKEGKIDLVEARAKVQTARRIFESHMTVLDTIEDYLRTESDKKGIDSAPKVD